MRMRKRNTLVLLAVLWAVLLAAVVDGARTGELPGTTVAALVAVLLVPVPIFWRLFRKARERPEP
ncbi:hypothetical protein CH340_21145 [Rhodoplanes serenus]|nr:hypothetical protein CH340_21145 [Rhodoplanes serenus]